MSLLKLNVVSNIKWKFTASSVHISTRWKTTDGAEKTGGTHIHKDDYQYMQKSKIPTLHFQKSLPRLPIPDLEKTCSRYLSAQRPLLNDEEFSNTESLVKNFKSNEGHKLHTKLKKSDSLNKHTSYISKPWFDMYLTDRTPLPINYNPLLVFNNCDNPDYNQQHVRAANFIISSLRFMKSLRKNVLNPEVFHLDAKKSDTDLFRTVTKLLPSSVSWYGAYMFNAYPLDMSQYSSLFNSTRIPNKGRDKLFKDESGRHVCVMRNGHFFVFDVLQQNGDIMSPEVILGKIKQVLDLELKQNEDSIGVLTTEDRDVWWEARQHLTSLTANNHDCLTMIDSALFVVCLDDVQLGDGKMNTIRNFLHGDGLNRWFDKSFSLLLSRDGQSAVNFEHSWGDGVAVLRYFQDMYNETTSKPFVHPGSVPDTKQTQVRQLKFDMDEKAINYVKQAKSKFDAVCRSLSLDVMEIDGFGKSACKSVQVSPDAVMQLAFQVAYHRLYGKFVGTYESCSTAAFKHGRTETIRPCTTATKQFALSINSSRRDNHQELLELLKTCSQVHGTLTKEAAMGQGFDRHLFGLKYMSTLENLPLPELYKDPAFTNINHNILSTSTLSSDAVRAGAFGPVVQDGLGVGYSILNNKCGAVVSSYPKYRDGAGFTEALRSTIQDIRNILNK